MRGTLIQGAIVAEGNKFFRSTGFWDAASAINVGNQVNVDSCPAIRTTAAVSGWEIKQNIANRLPAVKLYRSDTDCSWRFLLQRSMTRYSKPCPLFFFRGPRIWGLNQSREKKGGVMKPRGPLMIEHRLIEKMMGVIEKRIPQIRKTNKIEPAFVDSIIDFMRTYTDGIHHGKEEEIYFRGCAKKSMEAAESEMLKELIEEHNLSRYAIETIVQAKEKYLEGEDVLHLILEKLQSLVDLYRGHIEKEDQHFFPDSEKYLSETEQMKMLEEFSEFDKKVVHEKYRSLVENLKE